MKHVMIDLETLSTDPDAAFISIGACQFDPDEGKIYKLNFYTLINWKSAMKGRSVSASTLQWWLKQDREAIKGIMDSGSSPGLKQALMWLSDWFPTGSMVWSNGANFDLPILEHAYTQYEIEQYIPWKYHDTRDVRTICALVEGMIDRKDYPFKGTPHNALDDAIHQAEYVCDMWRTIRRSLRHSLGQGRNQQSI
ncbi:MAG: 3'-5' exonuclease [Sphaerochaetaceae bacterium]